jgi:hypothetical protein
MGQRGAAVAGNRICIFAPVSVFTATIERAPDETEELHLHAGGQGVWIARMAVTLGAKPVLCTPLGGETGLVVRHLLEEGGDRGPGCRDRRPDRGMDPRSPDWRSIVALGGATGRPAPP